ncbi:hypothetical protein Ancab_001741 [Ancistrocladus abbreviatus]
MPHSLDRELFFIVLQYLNDENFKEAAHKFEQESKVFFNMKCFEEMVLNGKLDEAERYLSAFIKWHDNPHSLKVFFELRKIKYLEALDRHDWDKAVEVLTKELKVFSESYKDLYNEMTQLITLENFRENAQLAEYRDNQSARMRFLVEARKCMEANPLLHGKLQFPNISPARLKDLVNQGLNWQHSFCRNPKPRVEIRTLYADHNCSNETYPSATPSQMLFRASAGSAYCTLNQSGVASNGISSLMLHRPLPPPIVSGPSSLPAWFPRVHSTSHPLLSQGTSNLIGAIAHQESRVPVDIGSCSRFRTQGTSNVMLSPPASVPGSSHNLAVQSIDNFSLMVGVTSNQEQSLPGSRSPAVRSTDDLPTTVGSTQNQGTSRMSMDVRPNQTVTVQSSNDLPVTVVRTFNQGSSVMSLDFHPFHHTILLVGTNTGDIGLWEVHSSGKLYSKSFTVWEITKCSMELKISLSREPINPVNRVSWSPDGCLFGIAFSKHVVHTYAYNRGSNIQQHFEIDAHQGGVNALAFSAPRGKPCLVTCGDDKIIRVWDASNGVKLTDLVGHEAPVYTVLPHARNDHYFILSASVDGQVKLWLYDMTGPRIEYNAPCSGFISMAYSSDGRRLFACGTSKEGETVMAEWNEVDGGLRRTYQGMHTNVTNAVHFDLSKNRYLVTGDNHHIKYWDVDDENILLITDAEGGLPANPCIRFNKDGSLLAVSTDDNRVKILANINGQCFLRTTNAHIQNATRIAAEVETRSQSNATQIVPEVEMKNAEHIELERIQHSPMPVPMLAEIEKPDQLQALKLCVPLQPDKVSRLTYTNAGTAILALSAHGHNVLWRWQRTDRKSDAATTKVYPVLCHQSSGLMMTNDMIGVNCVDATPCLALSKNDSYCISASGGKASLFNLLTAKLMTTFASAPLAATVLSFLPKDNNIIAIGLNDSTIRIYNIRQDEILSKLEGHTQRITSIAISSELDVLVSAGADCQIIVWSGKTWEILHTQYIPTQDEKTSLGTANIQLQFHRNQLHFLVIHERQLSIFSAIDLVCISQWTVGEPRALISGATFSCDGQLIYCSFTDGTVCILVSYSFRLVRRILPTAYLPSGISPPISIAAHPHLPNQFALGLTNGEIFVLEPLEEVGKWDALPHAERGSSSTRSTAPTVASASEQP